MLWGDGFTEQEATPDAIRRRRRRKILRCPFNRIPVMSDDRGRIASGIVSRLSYVIDSNAPRPAAASITRSDLSSQTRPGSVQIRGQFAFLLRQGDIGGTFLGVNWGDNHILYLVDPESGVRSGFADIEVRSPWQYRWGIMTGVVALFGAYGAGGWFLFRRMRRSTPETSVTTVGTNMGPGPEPTSRGSRR
jgi:hypothetical protein